MHDGAQVMHDGGWAMYLGGERCIMVRWDDALRYGG
jgi:hypothetical protein